MSGVLTLSCYVQTLPVVVTCYKNVPEGIGTPMAGNRRVQIVVSNHLLMVSFISHADQYVQIAAVIGLGRNNGIAGIAVAFLQIIRQRLHCLFESANLT